MLYIKTSKPAALRSAAAPYGLFEKFTTCADWKSEYDERFVPPIEGKLASLPLPKNSKDAIREVPIRDLEPIQSKGVDRVRFAKVSSPVVDRDDDLDTAAALPGSVADTVQTYSSGSSSPSPVLAASPHVAASDDLASVSTLREDCHINTARRSPLQRLTETGDRFRWPPVPAKKEPAKPHQQTIAVVNADAAKAVKANAPVSEQQSSYTWPDALQKVTPFNPSSTLHVQGGPIASINERVLAANTAVIAENLKNKPTILAAEMPSKSVSLVFGRNEARSTEAGGSAIPAANNSISPAKPSGRAPSAAKISPRPKVVLKKSLSPGSKRLHMTPKVRSCCIRCYPPP